MTPLATIVIAIAALVVLAAVVLITSARRLMYAVQARLREKL